MAGLLPAPRVGAMAEGLDAVEDKAPGEACTALEAAAVAGVDAGAVADIHLPMLRAFLTLRPTNTPLHSLLLRRSTTTTWF